MLTVVPDPASGDNDRPNAGEASLIDQIVREGVRRMQAEALKAEVDAYITAFVDERDEHGRRLVVHSGYHQPCEVLTSAGAVEVTVPRVNDRRVDPDPDPDTGERKRFSSAVLPPWAGKTRRSPRCCRCCTCAACPRATSSRRWASSSVPRRACPPR
jgi:hypothetical protein